MLDKGFTVDFKVKFESLRPGQIIFDAMDSDNKGFRVITSNAGTVELQLNDGIHRVQKWQCDEGLLRIGQKHHITFIIDGQLDIITVLVDGSVCDGGSYRQYGWGRFSPELRDVSGSGAIRIGLNLSGSISSLRVYSRSISTSEAVLNYKSE